MLERLFLELPLHHPISFAAFMRFALYDPQFGYYAKQKRRVGRCPEADFYTAQSLEAVFYPLLLESIQTLVGESLSDYTFIEIGAEGDYPFPESFSRAFKAVVRYGCHSLEQDLSPIYDKAVLFSNELFDAQPFHRLIYQDGTWKELGLIRSSNGGLEDCFLPNLSPELALFVEFLPQIHRNFYRLDLSIEANHLLKRILKLAQKGLFLAFDYGYSWQKLLYEKPKGTARAYHKHSLSQDLLAHPGEQDLTCHVCWDFLIQGLKDQGYSNVHLKTQEAFFIQQAPRAIQAIIEAKTKPPLNTHLQSLKELLHPQHMGHTFQVLYATQRVGRL